jgi:hypothetical protein
MKTVEIVGFLLFLIAAVYYLKTWRSIRQLVAEVNENSSKVRYSWFWWMPAWKVHAKAYPSSRLRRTIVLRFLLTFALLTLATIFLTFPKFHNRFAASKFNAIASASSQGHSSSDTTTVLRPESNRRGAGRPA